MQPINNTPAKDFNTLTSERTLFPFSRLKGTPLILSFYRKEAFSLFHYRLQTLKKYAKKITGKNVTVVSVFQSMPKEILEFAGRSEPPFFMLADPMGLIYNLYGIEADEEKNSGTVTPEIKTFTHIAPDAFQLSVDFFIDADFIIRQIHYTNCITDSLSTKEILGWMNQLNAGASYNPTALVPEQSRGNKVA